MGGWRKARPVGVGRVVAGLLAAAVVVGMSVATSPPAGAVVGGTPANRADYPYFSSIVGRVYDCGGAVIADSWVLTAAHCVDTDAENHFANLQLGAGDPSVSLQPVDVKVHPLWNHDHTIWGHDVALIRVADGPLSTVPKVQVGAPWDPGAFAPDTSATVMGYGRVSSAGDVPPGFLTADIPLRSDEYMRGYVAGWNGELLLGAGSADRGPCHGDSGGPLVVNRNGRQVEVGVVSTRTGDDCASVGVYTRLSGPQLAWIASVVPDVMAGWGDCPLDGGALPGRPVVAYASDSDWHIDCVPQAPGYRAAHRGAGGQLRESNATSDLGPVARNGVVLDNKVAAGTSPAIASLATRGRVIAFHDDGTDDLWTVGTDNVARDTHTKMAVGSSPAITALPSGGYEIAFVGSDGRLREVGSDGVVRFAGAGPVVAAATNPAIAAARTGFEIVLHAAASNTLWTVTEDNAGHDSGIAMVAGGSPSIAALAGWGYEVAFAGPGGSLWEQGPNLAAHQVASVPVLAQHTSPAIAVLTNGSVEIAMVASTTSTLWIVGPLDASTDTGRSPAAGTSPAIVGLPAGGYQIAYQSPGDHHLRAFGAAGDHDINSTLDGTPAVSSARVGRVAGYAGKCMDVSGANRTNGTQVQLWTCNGGSAQQWALAGDGTFRALGKCLDVAGGSTVDNARVQIWDCNGTGAQVWQPTSANELRNPQSGRCLDVTGANSSEGTPLQLLHCTGGGNQVWYLPLDSSADLVATVPYVINSSDTAARAAIQSASLTVGPVSSVVNLAPVGTVLGQYPDAGTVQPVNSGVGLVESAGGVETPTVLSLFEYEARNLLTARGLPVTVDYQKACIDPGKVIAQSPSAGAVVAMGATVHLTVDSSTSGTCIVK